MKFIGLVMKSKKRRYVYGHDMMRKTLGTVPSFFFSKVHG